MDNLSILKLMRLVSPALPVGAFAYSQGLEGAIENHWIKNDQQTYSWINGILQNNIANLDLPVLHAQLNALKNNNAEEFKSINATINAHRETAEFRLESTQMGKALITLLKNLHPEFQVITNENKTDWVSAFALACHLEEIEPEQALIGYAWSWCENQIAAAIKLVPLGQTQGQQLLGQLLNEIPKALEIAKQIQIDEVGAIAPHLAIISSQHETQYSRLFRS